MPTDRELRQLTQTVARKLPGDPNRPYVIRRRRPGRKDSRGADSGPIQYDTRTIMNMRTQPLGDKELNRLSEGLRDKTWRFVEVVAENIGEIPEDPKEFLNFGDQFQYKGNWYEVKMINDWDIIQGCKAVHTE